MKCKDILFPVFFGEFYKDLTVPTTEAFRHHLLSVFNHKEGARLSVPFSLPRVCEVSHGRQSAVFLQVFMAKEQRPTIMPQDTRRSV